MIINFTIFTFRLLILCEERYNRFVEALNEEAPTSIRLNPLKVQASQCPEHAEGQVPWCHEGYYLKGRPPFTFDPLLHAGCYYVQEASSMFITHVLRTLLGNHSYQLSTINYPLSVLDLCAAPGGKSTAMRSVLPEGSTLVSNEPIANRAQILLENITKWGWDNCIVTNHYPRDFKKAGYRTIIMYSSKPSRAQRTQFDEAGFDELFDYMHPDYPNTTPRYERGSLDDKVLLKTAADNIRFWMDNKYNKRNFFVEILTSSGMPPYVVPVEKRVDPTKVEYDLFTVTKFTDEAIGDFVAELGLDTK